MKLQSLFQACHNPIHLPPYPINSPFFVLSVKVTLSIYLHRADINPIFPLPLSIHPARCMFIHLLLFSPVRGFLCFPFLLYAFSVSSILPHGPSFLSSFGLRVALNPSRFLSKLFYQTHHHKTYLSLLLLPLLFLSSYPSFHLSFCSSPLI